MHKKTTRQRFIRQIKDNLPGVTNIKEKIP